MVDLFSAYLNSLLENNTVVKQPIYGNSMKQSTFITFGNQYDHSFNYKSLKAQRQIQWSNCLDRLIILCRSFVEFTHYTPKFTL